MLYNFEVNADNIPVGIKKFAINALIDVHPN